MPLRPPPTLVRLSRSTGFWIVLAASTAALVELLYIQRVPQLKINLLMGYAALCYFASRLFFVWTNGFSIVRNELLVAAVLLSAATAIGLQDVFGYVLVDANGESSRDRTVSILVNGSIYLFAGAAAGNVRTSRSTSKSLAVLACVLVPVLNGLNGRFFLDYYTINQNFASDYVLTHLELSEWCVLLLFGAYAFSGPKLRIGILIVAAYVLFALQGRSSTFLTIGTFLLYGFLTHGFRQLRALFAVGVVVIVIVAFTPATEYFESANTAALKRMTIALGEDAGTDSSIGGRVDIMMTSIRALPGQIPFGDPSYIVREFASLGHYIHNLLSVWQFFGLGTFLLVATALYCSARAMWRTVREGPSAIEEFGGLLLVYTITSVILSKSVLFYWMWFCMGFWLLRFPMRAHFRLRRRRRVDAMKTLRSRPHRSAS